MANGGAPLILYVIRHGQSTNNAGPRPERVDDPPLTDVGQQQALAVAEWVKDEGLTHLFTSPFLRTVETTEPIRNATGLRPEIWVDLHEQGGCVSGEDLSTFQGEPGLTRSQIEDGYPDYQVPETIDSDGWWKSKPAEPMDDARLRVEKLAHEMRCLFGATDHRIACVTHGGSGVMLVSAFLGPEMQRMARVEWHGIPPESWLGGMVNTAVTRMEIKPDSTQLVFYNSAAHLPRSLVT